MARNHGSARDAGTRLERSVAEYMRLTTGDDAIDRQVKRGKDLGDVRGIKFFGFKIVAELKDVARMDLPGWLREAEAERGNADALAGVVIHKRHGKAHPADQYVTMTLDTFVALITLSREHIDGDPLVPPPS
jgi:hypothetical protein